MGLWDQPLTMSDRPFVPVPRASAHKGDTGVCWHAPDPHALLESGLWPDMSHFLKTTPVRFRASAMSATP
jgi:hypothetical protein